MFPELSPGRKIDIVLLTFLAVFLIAALAGLMGLFTYYFKGGCTSEQKKLCLVENENNCSVVNHKSVCGCIEGFKLDDGPIAGCIENKECLFTRKRICRTHEDVENQCFTTGEKHTEHTCLCEHSKYVRGIGWKSCAKEGRREVEFFDLATTWGNASDECRLQGYDDLVVIHDARSYIAAVNSIPKEKWQEDLNVHIGMSGKLTSHDNQIWLWADGLLWTSGDYDMWEPGYPLPSGNHPLGLSCIMLRFKNASFLESGGWIDASCRLAAGFICEKYKL